MTRLPQLSLLQRRRTAAGLCLAWGLLLLALILSHPSPAQAAGVVTTCTQAGLLAKMASGNGLIQFNCGSVTIAITQTGGLTVTDGHACTIDGGNLITLNGGDANRIFWVQSGGALTITNITLSHGNAASVPGPHPLQGGAIFNDGGVLLLNHATVRDSRATYAAGAIENAYATTMLIDSLIENNQSDYGGGVDN